MDFKELFKKKWLDSNYKKFQQRKQNMQFIFVESSSFKSLITF